MPPWRGRSAKLLAPPFHPQIPRRCPRKNTRPAPSCCRCLRRSSRTPPARSSSTRRIACTSSSRAIPRESRWCSCTAAPGRARARCIASSSILPPIASSSTTSAAPGARRRSVASSATPPATWSRISSGRAATPASSAGWGSGARGFTPGARLRRAPSARCLGSCCAHLPCAREIDWFLYGLRAIFPKPGARSPTHSQAARRPARRLQRLTHPIPRHMPAAAAGASTKARARRCCPIRRWSPTLPPTAWRSASRASSALFRQHIFLPGFTAAQRRQAQVDPGHRRAGALRHRLPGGLRRRPAQRLAAGPLRDRRRRRPLRIRAGNPLAPHRRDRGIQDAAMSSEMSPT